MSSFGFLSRFRRGRARPIFQAHDIFAGRLTEGLLHALISDSGFLRADTRVRGADGTAIIVERAGACGRLILFPALGFGHDADFRALEGLGLRHGADRAATIVVVGGSEAFGLKAMNATAPARTLHVDDLGAVRDARGWFRSSAPRLVIESALDRMAADLKQGAFVSVDFETVRDLVSSEREFDLRPKTPVRGVVTSALTFALILCFAVEVWMGRDSLGGSGATLTIAWRMGAIHRPAIVAGEWQRLIAAPFLHFGLLHLFMNGWAQWSLGAPIEFLVGSWPFLALWVGSALGASLTSLFFNQSSVAAGASGAIFGLLGAFTTFVFFRKDVLPQPVPRPLRNGVLATLLLNLMISFIPSIDMAAHAGGFLTGAVLGFGLARRDPSHGRSPARSGPVRVAVAVLVALGVGITSIQERPDLATRVPRIEREHRVEEVILPIPSGFAVTQNRAAGFTTVQADGEPASPFSVTYRISEPQQDDASARRLLQSLRPPPPEPQEDPAETGWIAVSQMGIQNLRAIEVVVTAPASCVAQAEKLGSDLARAIH
jgi:membrane associated rhomboid family serine protease